jgi:hypothetical protein
VMRVGVECFRFARVRWAAPLDLATLRDRFAGRRCATTSNDVQPGGGFPQAPSGAPPELCSTRLPNKEPRSRLPVEWSTGASAGIPSALARSLGAAGRRSLLRMTGCGRPPSPAFAIRAPRVSRIFRAPRWGAGVVESLRDERWRSDRGKSPRRDKRAAHRAQAPGEEEVRDLRGRQSSRASGTSDAAV